MHVKVDFENARDRPRERAISDNRAKRLRGCCISSSVDTICTNDDVYAHACGVISQGFISRLVLEQG